MTTIPEARAAVKAAETMHAGTRTPEEATAWALERQLLELVQKSMTDRLNARNVRAKAQAQLEISPCP